MDTNMNTPRILTAATIGLLLLGFSTPMPSPRYKPHPPLRKALRLAWKAHTGSASFRTNVILKDSLLIMGSNGSNFQDWNLFDSLSGIHVLRRSNGKPMAHFANEALGDMDVNGTLLLDGRLYFGNDNDELSCTTPNGRTLWNIRTSGDIEHEPVTLRSGNRNLVVFATETGEVCAVEPVLGKKVWSFYLDDFYGWKTGDNRAWFKVTSHFTDGRTFYTKPILADLNLDGTDDLVYVTFYSNVVAIDGRNGRKLWSRDCPEYLSRNLTPTGSGKDIAFLGLQIQRDGKTGKNFVSLTRIDAKGKQKNLLRIRAQDGIGLNTLTLPSGDILMTTTDRLLVFNPHNGKRRWINRALAYHTYDSSEQKTYRYSRNSSESLLGNRTFPYQGDSSCIAIVDQYDQAFSEKGVLEIVSLDKGRVLRRFSLEARSELPPLIEDIDRDGRLDMLINSHNDTTYCYRLER
jgi:outer membrane protein assembly factor BamB